MQDSAAGAAGSTGTAGATGGGNDAGQEPASVECTPDYLSVPEHWGFPEFRQRFSGSNGVFVDDCEGGELIQYACETTSRQLNPDYPETFLVLTGKVIEGRVNCGGRCVDGACPNPCPRPEERARFVSISDSGEVVLQNLTSGWKYVCQYNGRSWVGFDCSTIEVGDDMEIILGPTSGCTHELGSLALGEGIQGYCAYDDCVLTDP